MALPRTSLTIDVPLERSEGSSAVPMVPETPLTRILEFMVSRTNDLKTNDYRMTGLERLTAND
jgi:hypothetical protein